MSSRPPPAWIAAKIVRAAIHHRRLGAGLRCFAELRERLDGVIDSDHLYDGAPAARGSQ